MKSFDPTAHHFVLLTNHTPAQGVQFYEYKSHASIDGTHDLHRLNIYLSKDDDFVNIWHGCLEPIVLEMFFKKLNLPFVNDDEPLFRGYIESEEQGETILAALRIEKMSPQLIEQTEDEKIVFRSLEG